MPEPLNPFAAPQGTETPPGTPPVVPVAPVSAPLTPTRDPGSDDEGGNDDSGVDPAVKAVLAKERRAARDAVRRADAAEAKLREVDDAKKTDIDRATERAARAEQALAQLQARSDRLEVAAAKGLSPTLAARLQGSTREQLEADADELLALVGPGQPRSTVDPDQGRRDSTTSRSDRGSDMNQWMRDSIQK